MAHAPQENPGETAENEAAHPLARALGLRAGEALPALLGGLTIFVFFTGWGMVRPLRDAMGVERGFGDMPWLVTATMAFSLLVSPVVAWALKRWGRSGADGGAGRRRLVSKVYRFFACNLLLFALAKWLVPEAQRYMVGYAFFVWASVFNMTCVSVFWGLMADVFPRERSLRAYGLVALGATLGMLAGATAAKEMAGARLPAWVFMLALAAGLEVAARLANATGRRTLYAGGALPAGLAGKREGADVKGGGVFSGIGAVARSPMLLGVCGYLLIYTVTSTFFWLIQQRVVMEAAADQSARTALNATIDQWANLATLAVQLLLTGRVLRAIGPSGALATTPLVTLAGLVWMGQSPAVGTVVPAVVTRRTVHYGVDRPGREALYTVIPPEQKYTAKSFIDTFVYRGGDVLGAWLETALRSSSVPLVWFAAPLCLIGAGLGVWLGRVSQERESERA